uniref:MADF domain-containing protein n=1 Tax=Strongyloides venezuelensis TaxID=75913 RepID=A0A0K0F241_STRVS
MTRFSKKSSTISLNSNISVPSVPKPYNPLEHLEICINITKNCNLPIPDTHKSFYESYLKYISFKKYPQIERRFEVDTIKKPLIVSCCDATHYMTELALPEKINKLKFNYNWAMERWKIMYKKRIAIERFRNSVEKIIEISKRNLNNNFVSIKCDPWLHYMSDPYLDSTVYSTKYCLRKIKEKYHSYFVYDDELFTEVRYPSHYLYNLKETINDSDEDDIQLPSSFNNTYNYKETLKEKKSKKKLSTRIEPNKKYNTSNHSPHHIEFIYFVKKIIMERKRTNPSGDPWDAFFYIHMAPDKKNLIFKMNKNEMIIKKNDPVSGVKRIDEEIIKENNTIISLSNSTSLTSQLSDYNNDTNSISDDVINMENDNNIEIIEKNKEDFEKLDLNDDKWRKVDKNYDHKEKSITVASPKYSTQSMGLSRNTILPDKLFLQHPKNKNNVNLVDEKISEKVEVVIPPIPKVTSVDVRDVGTNTLPLLYKNSQINNSRFKYSYSEKKKHLPTNSRKQTAGSINWKVTSVVRYSPDGRTTSNRSFFLPRIVRPPYKPLPKTSVNIPFSNNSRTLPPLTTSPRPSSSFQNTTTQPSHQNLFPKLF